MKIRVITVSDRAFAGDYEDRTGPAVVESLASLLPEAAAELGIVPDDPEALRKALDDSGADVIIAAGGTGLGPRDSTPEVLESWGDRSVPGIGELLRTRSLEQTSMASLSRMTAVQKGRTLAVAMPGSVRGAVFCTEVLAPLLGHAVKMMAGGGH